MTDDLSVSVDETAAVQDRKFQRELTAGLTALVLLSVLAEVGHDLYGYEIARRLTSAGDAVTPFKQGALYPVLRNMSAAGLLSSRVVPSYSGPPRRYYRITPIGREVLASWRASWNSTRDFVDTISSQLGLLPRTQQRLESLLERRIGQRLEDLHALKLAGSMRQPLLVVHDERDRAVPFECGASLAAAWPGAELYATQGLGHSRILRDERVISAVTGFISGSRS